MSNSQTIARNQIKKLHIEATVYFAVNHIPSVHQPTLEKYLELVNITGNFGSISEEELLEKMALIMKHIPCACERSLRTLGELLGVRFPVPVDNSKVVGVIRPARSEPGMRLAWQ